MGFNVANLERLAFKHFPRKRGKRVWLAAALSLLVAACAPVQQGAFSLSGEARPDFVGATFVSYDGAELGLNAWTPDAAETTGDCGVVASADSGPVESVSCSVQTPASQVDGELVIIAVHGMNDYAGAFNAAGPWWASRGATVYAYDQRGHGRSPRPGIWAEHEVMREDLRTAVAVARAKHPDARIAVVGESMGASVAITAFASDRPPDADVLVMSGPGLRGWGALPLLYSVSLWTSAHVRPGWIVVPPRGVQVTPTDNIEKLREMWDDPHVLKRTRIDSVYGVVSIMEEADRVIGALPPEIPALLLYGANDEIIPEDGVKRAAARLPDHVATAYYADGYHMLMNDLQAETVWADVLSFALTPENRVPSGAPNLPWVEKPG
jgi:acylglycerol lipase